MSLLFALDYDGTYTADPDLWNDFLDLVISRCHRVIITTMKYPLAGKEIEDIMLSPNVKIIYTSGKSKFAEVHRQGFDPDIWIDGQPHFIFTDASNYGQQELFN